QHRMLADDLRVRANIRRARRLLDQAREIVEAAGGLQLALPRENLADGDRVGRLVALDERRDRVEDQAVIGAVEIGRLDGVGDLVPRAVIEHEPAEHRALGFDGMRREPQLLGGPPPQARGTLNHPGSGSPARRYAGHSTTCSADSTASVMVTSTSLWRWISSS